MNCIYIDSYNNIEPEEDPGLVTEREKFVPVEPITFELPAEVRDRLVMIDDIKSSIAEIYMALGINVERMGQTPNK